MQPAVTPALNTVTGNDWSYYDWSGQIAYGLLYTTGYSGDVCAFNITTGQTAWVFSEGNSGVQSPFGSFPTYGGVTIANGIIYYGPSEHTPPTPMYRGYQLYAINATTGKEIWSIPSVFVSMAVADNELVGYNGYDNQIYAYGMGPSKTTVNAPDVGVTTETPITITGSVTDISAGSHQTAVAANFPNGLPCVSDASMSQFMAAVYMQQTMPTNLTGVSVTLSVTDSNGNHYNIGTAITDPTTGFYSLTWKPLITGNYTVTATFAGTQSYYGSHADTAFSTGTPASTTAPTALPVEGLASTSLLEYGIVAIIIVIVIIGAAIMLMLNRKHP